MRNLWIRFFLFLLFLLAAGRILTLSMFQNAAPLYLSHIDLESDAFRRQQLSQESLAGLTRLLETSSLSMSELLSVQLALCRDSSFALELCSPSQYDAWIRRMLSKNRSAYEQIRQSLAAIWDDVSCFPVSCEGISYENSWMFERNYGGRRGHEGTDLMPPQNLDGYYEVLSMTDGVVEQIGWLEKGGYRVGIRSPGGGYYYYAHLESYAEALEKGSRVSAGDLLGYMGDTGYGPEGTSGRFAVHLHVGIYIQNSQEEEQSVNPYWILKYLDGSVASSDAI